MSNQTAEWTHSIVNGRIIFYRGTDAVFSLDGETGIDIPPLICDKFNELDRLSQLAEGEVPGDCESDHASINKPLSRFNRVGIETFNWDGDEGAEVAIVDGVVNHIAQLRADNDRMRAFIQWGETWTLVESLPLFIKATEKLLKQYSYDGPDYEEMMQAIECAKKALSSLPQDSGDKKEKA